VKGCPQGGSMGPGDRGGQFHGLGGGGGGGIRMWLFIDPVRPNA